MRDKRILVPTILQNTGLKLPYTYTPGADGALPSVWKGATFSVSGGVIVNNPTLGAELLPDPGLEGNYTGGLNDNLSFNNGTPTCTQSATVHGGSKAQQVAPNAPNDIVLMYQPSNLTGWFIFSGWYRRAAGTNDNSFVTYLVGDMMPVPAAYPKAIKSATYEQVTSLGRVGTFSYMTTGVKVTGDTVLMDDLSLKKVTNGTKDLLASVNGKKSGLTVKAGLTVTNGTAGVASHVDDPDNPLNGIFAYMYLSQGLTYISVEKCVNGTWTLLIDATYSGAYADGRVLEIRPESSTTFSIWYNNAQIGATQTVNDASIVSNTYYSIFGAGGSQWNSFFLVAP